MPLFKNRRYINLAEIILSYQKLELVKKWNIKQSSKHSKILIYSKRIKRDTFLITYPIVSEIKDNFK
jgi:hypothetical protein